nr:hypothetical protein [Acinetobacter sp. ANC 4558]
MTKPISENPTPRSACIEGIATLTTNRSKTVMNPPSNRIISANAEGFDGVLICVVRVAEDK